jgi:hypothetical protein
MEAHAHHQDINLSEIPLQQTEVIHHHPAAVP